MLALPVELSFAFIERLSHCELQSCFVRESSLDLLQLFYIDAIFCALLCIWRFSLFLASTFGAICIQSSQSKAVAAPRLVLASPDELEKCRIHFLQVAAKAHLICERVLALVRRKSANLRRIKFFATLLSPILFVVS